MEDAAPARTRKRAQELIARQIGTAAGYNWQAHPNAQQSKAQSRYMTIAGSCLATAERVMLDFKWGEA